MPGYNKKASSSPSPSLMLQTPSKGENHLWVMKQATRSLAEPPFIQDKEDSIMPRAPPQLPKSFAKTPTPAVGFSIIHLLTPPWFNLLQDQRAAFDLYLDSKLWIQDWQASKDSDLIVTSDKLKELIFKMTGEWVKLSTPQQEKEIFTRCHNDRQKPPYHFLVSGILMQAYHLMLAHPIISTLDTFAFILPYNPPLPSILCTLKGFTLSIWNQEEILKAQEAATIIVWRTLSKDETLTNLLKEKLISDNTSLHNLNPATKILTTLEVLLAKSEDTIDWSTMTRSKKLL